ncbi:MAG TPA: hypothetical protein VGH15_05830 [Caulobacteraceae bacterium]|jgi:hypothetical protein
MSALTFADFIAIAAWAGFCVAVSLAAAYAASRLWPQTFRPDGDDE